MWIHVSGPAVNPNSRDIRLSNVLIEGTNVSQTNLGGPLIELGDPAAGHPAPGVNVADVLGRNVELVNSVIGYAALYVAGDSGMDTSGIDIEGTISGSSQNPGRGLQVEACQQCSFKFARNITFDYNVVIGLPGGGLNSLALPNCVSSNLSAPGMIYDGNGAETTATTCIDTAASALLSKPSRVTFP